MQQPTLPINLTLKLLDIILLPPLTLTAKTLADFSRGLNKSIIFILSGTGMACFDLQI